MSENGEIYTAGKKFYTPAGTDGMDKFHLCGAHVFYIFHCLVRLQIIHKKVRENLVPVGEAGLKNITLVFGEKGTVYVIFYQPVSLDRN